MANLEQLAKDYALQVTTYKKETNFPDWNYLILEEKFWEPILDATLDEDQLKEYFEQKTYKERDELFKFGVACYTSFVQKNYTGPALSSHIETFLQEEKFRDPKIAERLSINDEVINVNTKHPVLLVAAEIIFDNCLIHDLVNIWWCCRAIMSHQDIMDELSNTLLLNMKRLIGGLTGLPLKGNLKASIYIELAHLHLKFCHVNEANLFLKHCSDELGLFVNLEGKLGQRTHYEPADIAQLSLQVTLQERDEISRPNVQDITVPTNFEANDELLINRVIHYPPGVTKLPNTEQKLILAYFQHQLKATPDTELLAEEILPFLQVILDQQNTYCVRVMTLSLRCRLECKDKKNIERCLKQCEHILSYYVKDDPSAAHRIGDVWGVSLLPIWHSKGQNADALLHSGLVQQSLAFYLNLELWEEVIACYTVSNNRKKAAKAIKKRQANIPPVKLLCLLGDANDDESFYEVAWKTSKCRSYRAKRHWGNYFFVRQMYEESHKHFELSLSMNQLQPDIWSKLGYAALQIQNWNSAATACQRYVDFKPNSFDAWNNLTQAYLKIGNMTAAYDAVQRALTHNSQNCSIWKSLVLTAVDGRHFADLIRAYHKVLDLDERYLETESLSDHVFAVTNGVMDADNTPLETLLQKTRELVGRLIISHPTNETLWELSASLAPILLLRGQRLQRAFYYHMKHANWDRDEKRCLTVLNLCIKMGDLALENEIEPLNVIVESNKARMKMAVDAIQRHHSEKLNKKINYVNHQMELLDEKLKQASTGVRFGPV